jgi:hypothetical protein
MNTQPMLEYPVLFIKVVNTNFALCLGASTPKLTAQAIPLAMVQNAPNIFIAGRNLGARLMITGPIKKTQYMSHVNQGCQRKSGCVISTKD